MWDSVSASKIGRKQGKKGLKAVFLGG